MSWKQPRSYGAGNWEAYFRNARRFGAAVIPAHPTLGDIERVYRKRSLMVHPDKQRTSANRAAGNAAFKELASYMSLARAGLTRKRKAPNGRPNNHSEAQVAKRMRTDLAMAALRVGRALSETKRIKAARTIQRHWRGALADAQGRRIHRSRVVQRGPYTYNARNLANQTDVLDNHIVDNEFANVLWPHGETMSVDNRWQVRNRGSKRFVSESAYDKRKKHLLARQQRAANAYKRGPAAFEPFRRAGWRYVHLGVDVEGLNRPTHFDLGYVVQRRWPEATVETVLRESIDKELQAAVPRNTKWLISTHYVARVAEGRYEARAHVYTGGSIYPRADSANN